MDVNFVNRANIQSCGRHDIQVVLVSSEGDIDITGCDVPSVSKDRLYAMQKAFKKKNSVWDVSVTTGNDDAVTIVCICGYKSDITNYEAREFGAEIFSSVQKVMSVMHNGVYEAPSCCVITDSGYSSEMLGELAFGFSLRNYAFDRYISQDGKSADGNKETVGKIDKMTIASDTPEMHRQNFVRFQAIIDSIFLVRDFTNEPANVLTTTEFTKRVMELSSYGIEVEILGEREMEEQGMRSLLAVGAGSHHASYVAVMKWNGSSDDKAPICLVGKGVCFDSGGISIKPSSGMEEMISDMGGAALVTGIMKMLALSRSHVNVVAAIGLVENMPDGKAQRPGDIVKAMSGTTIEVVNTDAEGRMVLADVLWYMQEKYEPKCIVDFATLTGAIVIALGAEKAGFFSNNDALAAAFSQASEDSGEGAWRMPLGKGYAKINNSKVADVKNSGGRSASAISAAEFLHKFIKKDMPWIHVDIAGVAYINKPSCYTSHGATGWGVVLMDKFLHSDAIANL